VVPWKYGFKSIKSIVKIRFVEKQPPTTWKHIGTQRVRFLFECESRSGPSALEPGVGTAAGEFLKRKTLPFNGYGDQVAPLYAGLDLKKNF